MFPCMYLVAQENTLSFVLKSLRRQHFQGLNLFDRCDLSYVSCAMGEFLKISLPEETMKLIKFSMTRHDWTERRLIHSDVEI